VEGVWEDQAEEEGATDSGAFKIAEEEMPRSKWERKY